MRIGKKGGKGGGGGGREGRRSRRVVKWVQHQVEVDVAW